MGEADDQATSDGSDLCTTCGLCCDGTLFEWMEIRPDEVSRARDAGLSLFVDRGQQRARLPCSLLSGRCCTAYAARYAICHAYCCKLLRRLRSGKLDRATALARAAEALRLRDVAVAAAAEAGLPDVSCSSRAAADTWRDLADRAERRRMAGAHIAAFAMTAYLDEHFRDQRPPSRETVG